jgi:hypothetical protein
VFEELKPQELENDEPVAPEELKEHELNDIAGGLAGGTRLHAPGPGPPSP